MAAASTDASEIRRRGRQRLIGAIAIVLLLVVFIPMLLDSEPKKAREEPALDIPPKDNAAPLPPPAGTPQAVAGAPTQAPAPTAPAKPAASAPAASSAPQSAPATPSPAASTTPSPVASAPPSPAASAPESAPAPKLEGFAVQVGAFRDEAKLKHARDKLSAASIPHYTERLDTASGPLTRLRAGPFATRQAADAAAAKLKKEGGLASQVVPLP